MHNELVDFKSSDAGAPDHETTDCDRTNGHRPHGQRGDHESPDRLRTRRLGTYADRRVMRGPGNWDTSILVAEAGSVFTRSLHGTRACSQRPKLCDHKENARGFGFGIPPPSTIQTHYPGTFLRDSLSSRVNQSAAALAWGRMRSSRG